MQQGAASRTAQASISAALAVASADAAARLPPEEGHSLAAMAQRDLDAALQLLADRAQYITGSSGAAIALRRSGKRDMLCRASAGSNAPELGALLSTQFGLSGESVRTRQLLRCDDVDRDTRVNREACRQLGIASVAVMPVVNDDEVLGVFELFSGKVDAFAERDLTALRRLSEMVETAVKLSRAAEQVPERLIEQILEAETPVTKRGIPQSLGNESSVVRENFQAEDEGSDFEVEAEFVADAVLPETASTTARVQAQVSAEGPMAAKSAVQPSSESTAGMGVPPKAPVETAPKTLNRPLLWSIALDPVVNSASSQPERGKVPATLRSLRKCEACGFPVSPGRSLCVECEEKKWRGQIRPRSSRTSRGASAAAAAPAPERSAPTPAIRETSQPAKETAAPTRSFRATAQTNATESRAEGRQEGMGSDAPSPQPELVLSAAMGPPQSWFSSHKFVILTLLAAGAGAAVLLLR